MYTILIERNNKEVFFNDLLCLLFCSKKKTITNLAFVSREPKNFNSKKKCQIIGFNICNSLNVYSAFALIHSIQGYGEKFAFEFESFHSKCSNLNWEQYNRTKNFLLNFFFLSSLSRRTFRDI